MNAEKQIATIGELRSKALNDVLHRIHAEGPDILASLRQYRVSFVNERHPAAYTMLAASVLIQDMADLIQRQEHEIETWQAFAEQASKR